MRRKELGFKNQQALADAMGKTQYDIGRWEAGIHEPKGENLEELLKSLKWTRTDLFGQEPKELRDATISRLSDEITALKAFIRSRGYDPDNLPGPVLESPGPLVLKETQDQKKKK